MGAEDSIESVSKTSETQSKPGSTESGEEQFQQMMDTSSSSSIQTSFERVDVSNLNIQHLEHKDAENTQVAQPENATPHQLGSATDQENKRQLSDSGQGDEIEGVSEAGGVSGKGNASGASEIGDMSASSKAGSIDDIKKQSQGITSQIEEAKSHLSSSNGEIKSSYQKLLRNHLSHADDNLKIASSKVGLEYNPTIPAAEGAKPNHAQRFIQMLTNSEIQLEKITQELTAAASSDTINPTQLLAIQQKMHSVQQEIELFTSLLNKALESTKTLMNVQV